MPLNISRKVLKDELSENELKMFNDIGICLHILNYDYNVITYYNLVAQECFMKKNESTSVEALRRAMKWIHVGKFRSNKEFEKLIEFV